MNFFFIFNLYWILRLFGDCFLSMKLSFICLRNAFVCSYICEIYIVNEEKLNGYIVRTMKTFKRMCFLVKDMGFRRTFPILRIACHFRTQIWLKFEIPMKLSPSLILFIDFCLCPTFRNHHYLWAHTDASFCPFAIQTVYNWQFYCFFFSLYFH